MSAHAEQAGLKLWSARTSFITPSGALQPSTQGLVGVVGCEVVRNGLGFGYGAHEYQATDTKRSDGRAGQGGPKGVLRRVSRWPCGGWTGLSGPAGTLGSPNPIGVAAGRGLALGYSVTAAGLARHGAEGRVDATGASGEGLAAMSGY